MDYVTKSEVEQYTGLQIDAALDTFLDTLSAFAKQYIDETCSNPKIGKRWFDGSATPSTRYFDGRENVRLYVDDLRTITSLAVSVTAGDSVTLVENTDFFCYPLNAIADSKPIEWIELIQPAVNQNVNSRLAQVAGNNPFVFWEGQRNISITGKWGYNEAADGKIPKLVKMAALKLIAAAIKANIGDTDLKELTSETLGEYSASYAKIKDIADQLEIADVLEPLVRKESNKVGVGGMRVI